nr:hypothetical protein [Bradyrhizobium sp. CCBAU 53421]
MLYSITSPLAGRREQVPPPAKTTSRLKTDGQNDPKRWRVPASWAQSQTGNFSCLVKLGLNGELYETVEEVLPGAQGDPGVSDRDIQKIAATAGPPTLALQAQAQFKLSASVGGNPAAQFPRRKASRDLARGLRSAGRCLQLVRQRRSVSGQGPKELRRLLCIRGDRRLQGKLVAAEP